MLTRPLEPLRRLARTLAYSTPLGGLWNRLRGRGGRTAEHATGEFWDRELKGRCHSYLGGTISVDLRNATVVQLVRHAGIGPSSLLDVGCASGSLARAFAPAMPGRYVGVDISRYAIEQADPSIGRFHAANLCEWNPEPGERFEAIAFQEVLYYLEPDQAAAEVARYAQWLAPDGVIVFSLKDDPKSHAVLKRILRSMAWVAGVILQEQPATPSFRVRADRACPAFLIGVVRPGPR